MTSSTVPTMSSNTTRSPRRSGWVMASISPATTLASVWRAAKPTTAAAIALEVSSARLTERTASNCESAMAMPTTITIA